MVSTPEVCTNKSSITTNPFVSTKDPSEKKPLHQLSETLDVKHKTAVCRLGTSKEKHKATKTGNVLWSNIEKRHGHTKTNQKYRESLYNWNLHHLQVVQYAIKNYRLYVSINGNSDK